ncbi:MAG: polyprenyl synthetase family protein [Flavobacteriales bacterium]
MIEYSERIAAIEQRLAQWEFPSKPKNLYDPLRYFISIGGKRIRPLFTVLSAELYNISIQESLAGASALELFHNFTLIHDDIMDNAPVRRGLTTVHEKWDSNIAILSGDVLMIHAFQALAVYDATIYKRLSSLLNQTAIEVCIGQQMDMDFEQIDAVTEADYIEMIRLKTSVLLGCACAFGGIIGKANESSIKCLYEFGENLGIAFQIQDDILDAFGDSTKVGKQVGGDILSDKKTILYTTFQTNASAEDKAEFIRLSSTSNTEKVAGIKALYEASGVLDYCLKKQKIFQEKAMRQLAQVECQFPKQNLYTLADFIINRSH